MSRKEDEDEKRLYECARKYKIIGRQFEELMEIFDNMATLPRKRRNRRGSTSGTRAADTTSETYNNEALVQTVTRFLHELKTNSSD